MWMAPVLWGWPGSASLAWAGVGGWCTARGRLATRLLAPSAVTFPMTVGGALGRALGVGTFVTGASAATLLFGGWPVRGGGPSSRRLAARSKQCDGSRRRTLIHGEFLQN
jgi:hypothetical protein